MVKALASTRWSHVANRRAYLYRAVFTTARTHGWRHRRRLELETRTGRGAHWDLPNLDTDVRVDSTSAASRDPTSAVAKRMSSGANAA